MPHRNENKTGAMLSRRHELASGLRVRIRMAHRSDMADLRELVNQAGVDASEREVERLVHFDPRERIVIVATAFGGRSEQVVGVVAGDVLLDGEPDTLVVEALLVDSGLPELLAGVLEERIAGRNRRAA